MSGTRSERGVDVDRLSYEGDDGAGSSRKATLMQWLEAVLQATVRHWLIVVAIVLLGFLVLTVYYLAQTPLYRVQTSLLAQRQQAVPSIVRATVPNELPTRAAFELIHRRENIVSILKQTGLYKESDAPPTPGFKGKLRSLLAGAMSPSRADDDPLNVLVLRLNKALAVETGDGTVSIAIDWPDAQEAYQLVEAAMLNFLEARQLQEITAIDDAITLLQGRVSTLRQELDAAIAASGSARVVAAQADGPASPVPVARPATPESDGLAVLKAALDAKERALRDIEEFRRRRLAELQSQLEERRGVYAEAHPSVVALRKEIESLSGESPQVTALRGDEQRLRQEYNDRQAAEVQQAGGSARAPRPSGARSLPAAASATESERVRDARFRYQQMVERLNGAQLDLDTARAAFKYRYTVVWPAEVPRRPVSPNPFKIFGLGGLAVLLLAPLAAAWMDHRSGRVLTRFQVEVGLDVPVLADFDRKR